MLRLRRSRVLCLGRFYPPSIGGMQTHIQQLVHGMADSMEMRVLVANECSKTIHEWDERGIAVTRAGRWANIASASIAPGLLRELRCDDADIVHLHLPDPPAAAAYLASGHRGLLIVTYHSDVVRQRALGAMLRPLLHKILDRAHTIIVSSREYLETSRELVRHWDRCVVVPFGVPDDIGVLDHDEAQQAAQIRTSHGNRIVVAAGRLVAYKGFENAIRAMQHVDAHLLLVGGGRLEGRLQALIRKHNVAPRVTMTGAVPSLKPYLAAADVFVFPSVQRSEAFGLVQLEAMACGTPVVNTDIKTGVPFVSVHGRTGLTVPPSNPLALAAAVNQLLDNAPLRERYGAAARNRVAEHFDLETMIRSIRGVYQRALDFR